MEFLKKQRERERERLTVSVKIKYICKHIYIEREKECTTTRKAQTIVAFSLALFWFLVVHLSYTLRRQQNQ